MDILNTQAIDANVVDPLLDRLKKEIIPQLQTVVREEVNNAIAQASNVINGTLLGIQGTEDKAASDVAKIVKSLDGWTVTVGPFTIPAIPIQLSAPKEK
jgi:hypothetical protein